MTTSEIILLIITFVLLGIAICSANIARKWEDKYITKPTVYFSTDFDITKQINCIDNFYGIMDNRICKFKTTELTLGLSDNGRDYPHWTLSRIEGECIEGPSDLMGDRASFRSDKIYLTKNSLIENL